MQHASEFVLMFATAVYEAELAEVDRCVNYPMTVVASGVDLTVGDRVDLEDAISLLRGGIRAAGVTHMDRSIISAVQTDETFAVVTLETQRYGAEDQDLGAHQSTFVLDAIGESWMVRSLTVTDAPDTATGMAAMRRDFVRRYRNADNVRWTLRGPRKTD
ncbi:MAG: hypothetical protein AAFV19_15665 [Pseudomonadota bacterium]